METFAPPFMILGTSIVAVLTICKCELAPASQVSTTAVLLNPYEVYMHLL